MRLAALQHNIAAAMAKQMITVAGNLLTKNISNASIIVVS